MLFRFWASERGNVAIMFGIFIIPMLLGAGMALDFFRAQKARSVIQEATDAAVLAAARANYPTRI